MDDRTGYTHVSGSYSDLVGDVLEVHLHGPGSTLPNDTIVLHLDHTGGKTGTFEGDGHLKPNRVRGE